MCLDFLEDAMATGDFEEAVETILIDNWIWDSKIPSSGSES